jgi:hypothetical protein
MAGGDKETVVVIVDSDEYGWCNLVVQFTARETGGVTTRTVTDAKLRHSIVGEKPPNLLHARTTSFLGPAFVRNTRPEATTMGIVVNCWKSIYSSLWNDRLKCGRRKSFIRTSDLSSIY